MFEYPDAFSPDGRLIAASLGDGSYGLWDVSTRQRSGLIPVPRGDRRAWVSEFSPDNRLFVYSILPSPPPGSGPMDWIWARLVKYFPSLDRSESWDIAVVEVATGRVLARTSSTEIPVLSPDGRMIATREANNTIKIRDLPKSGGRP